MFGASDLGLSALFAATYPDRLTALVLSGVAADGGRMISARQARAVPRRDREHLGRRDADRAVRPQPGRQPRVLDWWARLQRSAASPGMARQLMDMISADRPAGGPADDPRADAGDPHAGRPDRADRARPRGRRADPRSAVHRLSTAADAYAWAHSTGLDDIEEFLTGRRARGRPGRPGPGDRPVHRHRGFHRARLTLGDGPWRDLLDDHNRAVRAELEAWRGTEIKSIGDGFLATFDGPARAISAPRRSSTRSPRWACRSARAYTPASASCVGGDVAGIAVHIGARVMERADPGEVLASSTVRDLVIGSGLQFADRGTHALRGVPDEWHLYALHR